MTSEETLSEPVAAEEVAAEVPVKLQVARVDLMP